MKAKKIRLKDLPDIMVMTWQPVCLSVSTDLRELDERVYYNEDCEFARSTRCSNHDFKGLIKEYGGYWVWDISLFTSDWGDPYIEISAVKKKDRMRWEYEKDDEAR